MKTEHRLAETLKIMMAEVPLDTISVTILSKRCHINRQTFYYHFHDIYDLLTLVFLDESIPKIDEAINIKKLVKIIYAYYTANKNFIDATLSSAGKELFQEFIYNVCYQNILRFIDDIPDSKKLKPNDRKIITRFYALAYSNSIVYYLSTYKSKSLEGLMTCFCFEEDDSLKKAVKNYLKARKR
ncbi:MAG: TetR/AcrR family transcriptional regulator C-terminal domain-containing protein [Bacilli bacterium]